MFSGGIWGSSRDVWEIDYIEGFFQDVGGALCRVVPGAVQIHSKRNSCWVQCHDPKGAVQEDEWAGMGHRWQQKGIFVSITARPLVSFAPSQRSNVLPRASVYLSVTPGGQQGMWRRLPPPGRICRVVNAVGPQLVQAGSGSSGRQSEGSWIGKERGGKTQPVLKGEFRFREDNS